MIKIYLHILIIIVNVLYHISTVPMFKELFVTINYQNIVRSCYVKDDSLKHKRDG